MIDCARLALLSVSQPVHDDLRYAHWGGPAEWLHTPAAFLAGYLCGPEQLARIAAGAPLYRDDRPVLEYAARHLTMSEMHELEIAPILRSGLDGFANPRFACVPDSTRQAASRIRDLNVGDMLASALLRQVDAAKQAADWPEAERLLHQALAANPRNATALRLMADAQVLQGRFAAAVPYFERALDIRADAIAARGLGFAKHRLGDVETAIVQYRAALAADPNDAEAHNLLGAALASSQQLDAALPHFERAVQLRPAYAEAAENLRRTRAALGHR